MCIFVYLRAFLTVCVCLCECRLACINVCVLTATPTLMFVVAAFLLGKLHKCNGIYI